MVSPHRRLRLILAAVLATLLAFRPYRFIRVVPRKPQVAQTQILLSVVASALMMIVGDNAARAFGIFAAVSLVRFRTNIRDPKEITVLLVTLGIGLATGVGKWQLALILTGFVMLVLWGLEYYESVQAVRAMELRVKTRSVDSTERVLLKLFKKHGLAAEVRELSLEDDVDPLGKVVYYVSVSPNISTDKLSQEIFEADAEFVDSVEWRQKKSSSYFYR